VAPPIRTHDGQAYLKNPLSGEVQAIPVAKVAEHLAVGYAPATDEQVDQVRLGEHYGSAGQQALTVAEGAARGVSGGLFDFVLPDKEGARHRREVNPGWATATEIGFGIGGMFLPMSPVAKLAGLGGKAGSAAASAAARATSREGVQKLAGTVAREATIGAGFGGAHAISDIALAPAGEMEGADAAKRVLTGLAHGAAVGGGLGVLAFGAGKAVDRAKGRISYGFGKVKEGRKKLESLEAEYQATVAEGGGIDPTVVARDIGRKGRHLEKVEGKFSKGGGEERIAALDDELGALRARAEQVDSATDMAAEMASLRAKLAAANERGQALAAEAGGAAKAVAAEKRAALTEIKEHKEQLAALYKATGKKVPEDVRAFEELGRETLRAIRAGDAEALAAARNARDRFLRAVDDDSFIARLARAEDRFFATAEQVARAGAPVKAARAEAEAIGQEIKRLGGMMASRAKDKLKLRKDIATRERELSRLQGYQDDIINTRGRLQGMEGELARGNATGARLADIRAQMEATQAELRGYTSEIAGKMFTKALGTGIGLGLDFGVTGGALGFILAPRIVQGIKGAFAPGGRGAAILPGLTERAGRAAKAARNAWESVADDPAAAALGAEIRDRAGAYVDAAAGEAGRRVGTRVGEAAEGAAQKVAGRLPIDRQGVQVGIESAGHAVGEGIGMAAALGPEMALQGAAMGGATGLLMGLAAHKMQHQLHKLGDLAVTKLLPASRIAALQSLTDADISDAADELQHIDTDALEAGALATMPEGLPPEVVQGMSGRVLQAIRYLKDAHPGNQQQAGAIPVKGAGGQPTARAMESYHRLVKTVIKPEELAKAIMRGDLRREHLAAWENVYPEALEQLRNVIKAEVARVKAAGGYFEPRKAALMATVLGEPAARPEVYNTRRVQMWQGMYQQDKQPGPPARPRPISGLSQQAETPGQGMGG